MPQCMSLSLGPVLFHWQVDKWRDFYARIADEAPVDVVYLGEVVCSKRSPFYADATAEVADRLRRAGKHVVPSTLALVTLPRERRDTAALVGMKGGEVEVNDITALRYLGQDQAFSVGPFINVYNEGTLKALAGRGALSVCLPPELSIGTVEVLAGAAQRLNVGCEVWAFGRIPLAISGRCYHARADGTAKDHCQFVCGRDADGRDVATLDKQSVLAINGVQTLSHTYCNTIADIDRLEAAGITSLRLSPHDCDMVSIAKAFRDRLDGSLDGKVAWAQIEKATGPVKFSNGFLFGKSGAEFVDARAMHADA